MECNLTNRDEFISAYLTGELPEDDLKTFEEHYFQCYKCFSELKIAEDAMAIISGGSLTKYTKQNVFKKFWLRLTS